MAEGENAHGVTGQEIAPSVVVRANLTSERVRNVAALGSVILVVVRVKLSSQVTKADSKEQWRRGNAAVWTSGRIRADSYGLACHTPSNSD
ncbi:hypothetical protein LCGC14_1644890 [marine sediment metagenome]|uniref:Uncharacterized protein n=1 Tax=marine sediment metagenome TaxID=412755 RepID=A0A0F9HYI1_9ZZZZ